MANNKLGRGVNAPTFPKTIKGIEARIIRLELEIANLRERLNEMGAIQQNDELRSEWQRGSHIDSMPTQPPMEQPKNKVSK